MLTFQGVGHSYGVGDGILYLCDFRNYSASGTAKHNTAAELQYFVKSVERTKQLCEKRLGIASEEEKTQIQNELLLLCDKFESDVKEVIEKGNVSAKEAVLRVLDAQKSTGGTAGTIGELLLYFIRVCHVEEHCAKSSERLIFAIEDDIAAFTLNLFKDMLTAVIVKNSAKTQIVSKIARALDIPVAVISPKDYEKLKEGERTAVDGHTGQVWQNPDPTVMSRLAQKRLSAIKYLRSSQMMQGLEAKTENGVVIDISAEVVTKEQAKYAAQYDAHSIGKIDINSLRYLDIFPQSEDELYAIFRDMMLMLGSKSVTFLVGEKCIADKGSEMIVFSDDTWQDRSLRALIRASAYGNLRILLCDVDDPQDMVRYKDKIKRLSSRLKRENKIVNDRMSFGALILTPVGAAIADLICAECDFIGADLDILAKNILINRTNQGESPDDSPEYHPSVMRTLAQIARMSKSMHVPFTVYGHSASDVTLAGFFAGLRVDEVCTMPKNVAAFKRSVRLLSKTNCKDAVKKHLQLM